ncbi:MAG: siroheme synthase, N-terminal domain [Anaerocolumna sp.]|jgi:siroheme synthase-like protein|nr:siroheme synthase, N-terminal domain [Anaerocolumna sp.]
MAYFPMFIDLKDKLCVIVGGGIVAYRKITSLLEFEAKVVVIAPEICDEILSLEGKIRILKRLYETIDIEKATLVIAATNDLNLNKRISNECNDAKIPVNVVDCQKECSFIFPAYLKKGSVTIGVTSSGKSPIISQRIKRDIHKILPDYIEDLVEILGDVREEVKSVFDTEEKRKKIFKQIVELGYLNKGKLTRNEIELIINKGKQEDLE